VFERAKTVHAFDSVATVISKKKFIKTFNRQPEGKKPFG
jgi:hypothetical protein